MEKLNIDWDEAESVYEYDLQVERGEKTQYDLTPDKMKIAREYTHTGTRERRENVDEKKTGKTVYQFTKRERKPNATKAGIISELAQFLTDESGFSVSDLSITNKERQIAFTIGEDKFELTLVQKRKPKK